MKNQHKIPLFTLKKHENYLSNPMLIHRVLSSSDLYEIAKDIYDTNELDMEQKEFFCTFYLSRSNRVLGYAINSKGSNVGTVIDFKEIISLSILSKASSVILVHNHPSGNLAPSNSDKEITLKLQKCLEVFDISILDHLILAPNYDFLQGSRKYFSFKEEGLL